ncbi:hypothetical protein AAHA92_05639 [Salvia divinorum]|uniref:Myb/SANT-like domain-containing protein n=1 Tax=Salvia divinorum TaxID=28513 RepID=A0ABD1I328_SALDI
MLLSTIVHVRGSCSWKGCEVPDWVIVEAERVMKGEHKVRLTGRDLLLRLEVLENRYKTFKEVVATEGVSWEQSSHVVVALEHVWSKMLKNNPFVGAYYHRDEPEFHMLASVFGLNDIKTESVTKVIIISDTTENLDHARHGQVKSSDDMDEVTSPIARCAPRACRKLFVGDELSVDRHSSTDAPLHYHAAHEDGVMKHKNENNLPCCSIPSKLGFPNASPVASSCASCNPFATTQKTAP